jgi:hypothetical protein
MKKENLILREEKSNFVHYGLKKANLILRTEMSQITGRKK